MSEHKERPILFSAPMVRAILDGTKTQTRRVLKQATGPSLSVDCDENGKAELSWLYGDGPGHEVHERILKVPCPYGQPGDRLWVRETWGFNPDFPGLHAHACYRADPGMEYDGIKWKPSIHMPRAACRIKLEITGVRVEKLCDISEADAIAEGVELTEGEDGFKVYSKPWGKVLKALDAGTSFRSLWQSINGAESWEANPFVWVVEFKVAKAGAA